MGEAHTDRSVQHGGVSGDALVLALASVIRPLSVAAVYAMLSAARPTRLLTSYVVTGFAVSIGIGVVLATIPEFIWELSFGIYLSRPGSRGGSIKPQGESAPDVDCVWAAGSSAVAASLTTGVIVAVATSCSRAPLGS